MEGAAANANAQNVNVEDMEISQEASTSTENTANEVMDFENASLVNENPPKEQTDINRALARAIRKRNDRKVRKLIGKGADVNHILEGTNRTPLKLAMQLYGTPTVNGRQIIKTLLKAGADANTQIGLGLTVLHIAAKTKDLSLAKRVLDCGAKLDILSDSGKTALRYAIQSNPNMSSIPFVAFLLDSGANVNLPNSDGETVIHHIYEAPQLESAQILDMLIHHGIELNAQCPTGHTPLHYAVIHNSRHTIRLLLNTGAFDQTIKSLAGETALHLAVGNNYIRSARILLNAGSNVNEPIDCFEKFTVLHVAAARGNWEMFQQLMLFNPDLTLLTNKKYTILHSAVIGGSEKTVETILEVNHNINEQADDGNTPLHLAVYQQNGKIVKLLLNYNVDLERKNKKGQTPLHVSAYSATPLITKLLIYKGADATTRCNNNRSILQAAFYGGNTDVFRLLLAPCCAPNFEECLNMLSVATNRQRLWIMNALISDQFPPTDKTEKTKLRTIKVLMRERCPELVYTAAADGLEHVIKLVTDGGYDLNQLVGGRSFLDGAVKATSLTIARLLLSRGIFLNISDNKYFNSLHRAIWNRSYAMTDLLLDHGANVNVISCGSKYTSLHYAVERDCHEIFFLALFAHGADLHNKNEQNLTPLKLSMSRPRLSTISLVKFEAIVNQTGRVLEINNQLISDQEFLEKMYKECLSEIDIAKNYFIHTRLSVWDVLWKPIRSLIPFMNLSIVMDFAKMTEHRQTFEHYYDLICFKLKRAMGKKLTHNHLHSHLIDIMGFPSVVVGNLLTHMTDGDKILLHRRLQQE